MLIVVGKQSYPTNPIIIENRRWDPLTGVLSAATATGSNMLQSTGEMFYNPYKEFKRYRSENSSKATSHDPSQSPSPAGPAIHSSTSLPNDQAQSQIPQPPITRVKSDQGQDPFQAAGTMAGATLQGFGKFSASYFRGVVVDIPHAAAEGFRRAPRLYGEKPKDYGTVHDWKSGMKVGGRNFVGGMTGGVKGIITEPVKGAIEGGRRGAVKGLARGTMGMATKMPSGECISRYIAEDTDGERRLILSLLWGCSWNRTDGVSVSWYFEKHRSCFQVENPQGHCECAAQRRICSHEHTAAVSGGRGGGPSGI